MDLLLGGVQARRHDQHRVVAGTRFSQDAADLPVFVPDFYPFARRPRVRHALAIARHRLHVRRAHLLQVLHEHELGEVVADRGADEVLART
jgi:hypothetical protein